MKYVGRGRQSHEMDYRTSVRATWGNHVTSLQDAALADQLYLQEQTEQLRRLQLLNQNMMLPQKHYNFGVQNIAE